MNISKRHHYISKFLIKGFVGDDGKLAIYDCKKKELKQKRMSPKQVLFEWDRNTFEKDSIISDFIEKSIKKTEDNFAPVYQKMISKNYSLSFDDIFHLTFFIGFLDTYLPIRDKKNENEIFDSSLQDLLISIINIQTGKKDINYKERLEELKKEPAFIHAIKYNKFVREHITKLSGEDLKNWYFFSSKRESICSLLSDNPVILRSPEVVSIYDSDFIFQLHKDVTIFHNKRKTIRRISTKNRRLINILTVLQSNKMVCGSNLDYLSEIVESGNKIKSQGSVENFREYVFQCLENDF